MAAAAVVVARVMVRVLTTEPVDKGGPVLTILANSIVLGSSAVISITAGNGGNGDTSGGTTGNCRRWRWRRIARARCGNITIRNERTDSRAVWH